MDAPVLAVRCVVVVWFRLTGCFVCALIWLVLVFYHSPETPLPLIFPKRWTFPHHFSARVDSPGLTSFVLN